MFSSRLLTLLTLPTRLLSLLLSTALITFTLLLITRASSPPPQIITLLSFSVLTLLQTLLALLLHHSTSTPHHHPPYLLLGDVLGVVGYVVSVLLLRGVGGRWGCVPDWGSVSSTESGSAVEKGATSSSDSDSGSGSGGGMILRLRARGLALESDDSGDIFDHTMAVTGSTNTGTLSVPAPKILGIAPAAIKTSTSTCHILDATFIVTILACGLCILTLALGVLMQKVRESERRRDVERARWEVEEASGFGKQGKRMMVEVRRVGSRES